MNPRVRPLEAALGFNSRMARGALDGLDQSNVERRPSGDTNHMLFLMLHLLDERFFMLRLCGDEDATDPYAPLLDPAETLEDIERFPPLDEVLVHWEDVTTRLRARLGRLDDAALDADCPFRAPVDDGSLLGGLMFLAAHEAYHVGQLGLIRKLHGHGSARLAPPDPPASHDLDLPVHR